MPACKKVNMGKLGKPPKRKKHSRTRTGCFTCRNRRVKCDERKPICVRCEKGSRECTFPVFFKAPSKAKPKRANIRQDQSPKSDSDFDSSSVEDISTEVVKFASASSHLLMDNDPDELYVDQQILIDSLRSRSDDYQDGFDSHSTPISLPEVTPEVCFESLRQRTASPDAVIDTLCIPRSPRSNKSQSVQFFLKFHQATITAAHYFRFYDYQELCTKLLPEMADQSDALRHAMVAFSALIYSMKVNRAAREIAFLYYSAALRDLRSLLDKPSIWIDEYHTAVAAALQLSTVDRFFGEPSKCLRHLKGVAHTMQKFSSPVEQSSTVLGRSLLECCINILPSTWRQENVRIRRYLARLEYPNLRPSDRKARLLDDLWPQLWLLYPRLADVLSRLTTLKTLQNPERSKTVAQLGRQLRAFYQDLTALSQSSDALEVLETAELPIPFLYTHTYCCPPPPFLPHILQFPPAGRFRLVVFSLRLYMHTVFYPALRSEGEFSMDETMSTETKDGDAASCAYEMCRTFAGIEYAFDGIPDALLPCFSLMALAGLSCSSELRMWLWYKLAHFEQLGQSSLGPIKKHLALWWDMPNLAKDGFGPWKNQPPERQIRALAADDIDAATKKAIVELDDESNED